jgi:hypothetical protein
MKESERKPALRDNFGPGHAGDLAYLAISRGTICEEIDKDDTQCEKISDRTVGFDILGNYEFIAVCSQKHADLAKKKLVIDLAKADRIANFDTNGFGRA